MYPQAENRLVAFHVDADSQVDRLGAHRTDVLHFDVGAVAIEDWVRGVEQAGLPELHILADSVRDTEDERRRHLGAVHMMQSVAVQVTTPDCSRPGEDLRLVRRKDLARSIGQRS